MPVKSKRASRIQDRDFVMEFVDHADEGKEAKRQVLSEVLDHYLSNPHMASYRSDGIRVRVKDPETFQIVETLTAKLLLSMMGDDGFTNALPVGREDAFAGDLVSQLQDSAWRRRGNTRAMYVGVKDSLIVGETVFFPYWDFEEANMPVRSTRIDPLSGEEFVESNIQTRTIRDHVSIMCLDFDDYYLEPDKQEISRMEFGVRRFTIPAYRAMQMAEDGLWSKTAVKRAIAKSSKDKRVTEHRNRDDSWRPDRNEWMRAFSDYDTLVGYEGYGNTPYMHRDGERRRKMTVLNGELVASVPLPLEVSRVVPFYEAVINPMNGRFGGVAPAAIARWTQSLADATLISIARSVSRKANPPVVVRRNAQVDMEAVRRWAGPIRAMNIGDIQETKYNPQLFEAFQLLAGLKQNMQNQSGALGAIQGSSFGEKQLRSSFEAQFLGQQAMDRPELMARLWETEYLPAMGQGFLELQQQFIDDSADLQRRVGKSTVNQDRMPLLDDIQGQFDIKFTGSRRARNKQAQMEFIERAMQVFGSVPGAAPIFPWGAALVEWLKAADLRKIESLVADPNGVEDFINRSNAVNGGAAAGNGNAAGVALPPAGLDPRQTGSALNGAG
jgi:hypothetical protein